MSEFLSANLPYLLSGISVGGQYALIAIGYTMVYGILRLINFAHGDVFMVAGLVMVYATASLPIYVSIVLVVVVTVAIGVIIEKVAYKPLRSAPRMSVMISAIGCRTAPCISQAACRRFIPPFLSCRNRFRSVPPPPRWLLSSHQF